MKKKVQLYHGDCLDILSKMDSNSVNAIITDPPYCSGSRQANTGNSKKSKSTLKNEEWFNNDNMGIDSYIRFQRIIAGQCYHIAETGAHAYIFTDWRQYNNIVFAWESKGWKLKNAICWDKEKKSALGTGWRNNHEWIAFFAKNKPTKLPHCKFYNTWKGSLAIGKRLHPTEKPVPLMEYLVEAVEGTIIDPFMGSGSTGVACRNLERNFVGIELDKAYYQLAEQRIQETA